MQALQYVCHCCHRSNWTRNKLASLQDTLVLNNDPPNDWQSQILSYLKGHPCPQLQGQVSIKHGWKEKPGQWVTAGSDWQVLAVDSSHTGGSHCWPAFKKNKAEIFMTLQKFIYRGNSSLACGYKQKWCSTVRCTTQPICVSYSQDMIKRELSLFVVLAWFARALCLVNFEGLLDVSIFLLFQKLYITGALLYFVGGFTKEWFADWLSSTGLVTQPEVGVALVGCWKPEESRCLNVQNIWNI